MNPPSATVFLSSAELVICLTPSFYRKQSAKNPFFTFPLSSMNPSAVPNRQALPNSVSLYILILWYLVKHNALTVINLLEKYWLIVMLTKTVQQGLQLFSKSRKANTL